MTSKKPSAQMFFDEPPKEVETPDLSPKVAESTKDPSIQPERVEENVEQDVGNIIDLPSKGVLGYPGSISHREIYAGDEEILKLSTNRNFSRTVNRVLKGICNDASFFDDMYVGDRDYILTWIWANTYDNEKRFEVTCKHCGSKEETVVDIFKLDEIPIKENFKSRFPLKIKKTGDTIYLRPVTVRDENNAEKFLADNPKTDYSFQIIQYAVSTEFGKAMSVQDRVEYLKESVTAKEMGYIKQYHRFFRFGLDTTFEHACGECQGVTHGEIPFLPEDIISPEVRADFEQLLLAD